MPGFVPEWHLGVRVGGSGKLMGFITAIPARIRVSNETLDAVEINFLCVHKRLRAKRLAPVLIKVQCAWQHLGCLDTKLCCI